MPLFSRTLPRRATIGAFIGFLYGLLLMPVGFATDSTQAILTGVGWTLLSVSLLFARAFSYYTWVIWALVWIAWKGVEAFRAPGLAVLADVIVPLVALALVSSSGYVEAMHRSDAE